MRAKDVMIQEVADTTTRLAAARRRRADGQQRASAVPVNDGHGALSRHPHGVISLPTS